MSCSSPFSIKTEQSPESFINEVKKNFEEIFKEAEDKKGGNPKKLQLTVAYYPSSRHFDIKDEIQKKMDRATEIADEKKYRIPGVYVFLLDDDHCDRCLKVGKVGNIAEDRWREHHYALDSANSTTLKSIIEHPNHFKQLLDKRGENPKAGEELWGKAKKYKDKKDGFLNFIQEITKNAFGKLIAIADEGKGDIENINVLFEELEKRNICDKKDYKKEIKKLCKFLNKGKKEEYLNFIEDMKKKAYKKLLQGWEKGKNDKGYIGYLLKKIDDLGLIVNKDKEKSKKDVEEIERLRNDVKKEAEEWLPAHTCRLEFIFDEEEASKPTYAENFLEGYLHWLLKPCYEGTIYDDDNSAVSTATNEEDENQ